MNERILKVVRDVFRLPDEKIEDHWTSNEIEAWDSLGHLNLILGLEREFGVKFETEEIFEIRTIGDIGRILANKTSSAKEKEREIKACPLCGNPDLTEVFRTEGFPYIEYSVSRRQRESILQRYSQQDLVMSFKAMSCNRCQHAFQVMIPDEQIMNVIYKECYNYPSPMLSGFAQEREKIFLKYFLDEIQPICQERGLKRVLEIACFDGFILNELAKKGFEVFGCDPSQGADIAAKFGIKVHKQYFESKSFLERNETFDIVIFRHFIEHVPDPAALIADVEKVVRKDGLMIIETPNIQYYLQKGSIESFTPQHYQNFSITSLGKVLAKAGWEMVDYQLTPENMIAVGSRRGKQAVVKNDSWDRDVRAFKENFRKQVELVQAYMAPFVKAHKKIVLWGAGGFGGDFFPLFEVLEKDVAYFVDGDERKWGMCFIDKNLEICSPQKLLSDNVDLIIITSMYSREILAQIQKMNLAVDVINMHPQVSFIERNSLAVLEERS